MSVNPDSLLNFISYLKPKRLDAWVIFYDSKYHKNIVHALEKQLSTIQSFDLQNVTVEEIRSIDSKYYQKTEIGILFFSIFVHAEEHTEQYLQAYEMMNVFDTWDGTKSIICDEVTDENFNDIFSENPKIIAQNCKNLKKKLDKDEKLIFQDGNNSKLTLKHNPLSASIYDGFQSHEHNIPSGEVAYEAVGVDGVLHLHGWIIGTIPFGQKYGKILPEEITIYFENGRIVKVIGNNQKLISDFETVGSKNKALWRVAEIGIGVNNAVLRASVGAKVGYEWMEKRKGLHLGLGAELTEHIDDYRNRKTHHHLDLIINSGSLSIGKEEIKVW